LSDTDPTCRPNKGPSMVQRASSRAFWEARQIDHTRRHFVIFCRFFFSDRWIFFFFFFFFCSCHLLCAFALLVAITFFVPALLSPHPVAPKFGGVSPLYPPRPLHLDSVMGLVRNTCKRPPRTLTFSFCPSSRRCLQGY